MNVRPVCVLNVVKRDGRMSFSHQEESVHWFIKFILVFAIMAVLLVLTEVFRRRTGLKTIFTRI